MRRRGREEAEGEYEEGRYEGRRNIRGKERRKKNKKGGERREEGADMGCEREGKSRV